MSRAPPQHIPVSHGRADSRWTEFYVTTRGAGRFWIEPADGDPLTPRGRSNKAVSAYGSDEYWTSWTEVETTWPIVAQTDAGDTPEQVVLRVEGYEGGDFELRVFGQFSRDDQP